MFFERIESPGLAHYSYIIGDQKDAIVIDPRRDCQIYIDKAYKQGFRITNILETHRNEDYAIGSLELSAKTDAEIWHADRELDYQYGNAVEDGQIWSLGRYKLKALHTPGHTPGSFSYILQDADGTPMMIFTGDALFAGDVGRVDLLGEEKMPELVESLYDSIFNKILPLGDEVIVCPAHGAGSVCGGSIAERKWTTIGLERKLNPKLQFTKKEEFIENNANILERPPYFRKMEKWNLEGTPEFSKLRKPKPMTPGEFAKVAELQEAIVLDIRSNLEFSTAHVPNSLFIWQEGLPNFAGWFLDYEKPILLVAKENETQQAMEYLARLGFDNVMGFLSGGLLSWHMSGRESQNTPTITTQEFCRHLEVNDEAWIVDVRGKEELKKEGWIKGAHDIHITQILQHTHELPKDKRLYIFCGSGLRSMIGASLLQREGWNDVSVILGGLSAWKSATCPREMR